MAQITTISTSRGPLYATVQDKTKLNIYSKLLSQYEKNLSAKYGKEFAIFITPTEYNNVLKLHNQVNTIVQRIKRNQANYKRILNK